MDSPESPLEAADGITKYGHGKNFGFWLVHGSNGPYSYTAHAHKLIAKLNVLYLLAKRSFKPSTDGSIGIDANET